MNKELLEELCLKTFVKIRNQHDGIYASLTAMSWRVEIELCFPRGVEFRFCGKDLNVLLQQALTQVNVFEQDLECRRVALIEHFPDKTKGEISAILRAVMGGNK